MILFYFIFCRNPTTLDSPFRTNQKVSQMEYNGGRGVRSGGGRGDEAESGGGGDHGGTSHSSSDSDVHRNSVHGVRRYVAGFIVSRSEQHSSGDDNAFPVDECVPNSLPLPAACRCSAPRLAVVGGTITYNAQTAAGVVVPTSAASGAGQRYGKRKAGCL